MPHITHETTPDKQLEVFNQGHELAIRANQAYDRADALDADMQATLTSVGQAVLKKAHVAAEHQHNQLVDKAGDAFDRAEFGDTAEATAESQDTQEGVWALLSPERHETARKTMTAMAEKFNIDQADLALLKTEEEDGSSKFVVAYTAPNGIDLGDPEQVYDKKRSWNSVMDNKNAKNFMIKVAGKQVDTRVGMTRAAYDAFIDNAKANNVDPLPDSDPLSEQNDQPWTWTLLTGERARADGFVPVADVRGGQVYQVWDRPDYDGRSVRVRPAVEI